MQQQARAEPRAETLPQTDSGMYFIVADDDPELPDQVTSVPSPANGGAPAVVAALGETAAAPAEQAAAGEAAVPPTVDDSVLAARMGADGAYLEAVQNQQAPIVTAAEPEPPKRRGFFASLFAAPEPRHTLPVAVQQPAPAPAATEAVPQQAAEPQAVAGNEAAPVEQDVVVAAAESTVTPQPAQPTAYLENRSPVAADKTATPRRSFLSAFFSNAEAAPRAQPSTPRPPVRLAAVERPSAAVSANVYGSDALPGVRSNDSLYEISRKSGIDDDSDIDINEGDGVQVAMAPGLARLAPNGLMVQTDRVDVACLKPSLVRVLKAVELHYRDRVVVTSGYRSPPHNKRARGARNSLHMYCAAADIQVEGVGKWELAQYLRSMPGRGGVGTYCHTNSVHVDVGPERDWNWRCRRRKRK